MKVKTKEYLKLLLFHSSSRCNDINALVAFAANDPVSRVWLNDLHEFDQKYETYLRDIARVRVETRADASRILLALEIGQALREVGEHVDALLDSHSTIRDALMHVQEELLEFYRGMGLTQIQPYPIRLVDKYPYPYEELQGAAMVPDRSDQERYEIPAGIYIKNDKISFLPSSLTVAHELVHTFVGEDDGGLLARGLEEGLAEFVGFMLAGPQLFENKAIENVFISKRLKFSGHVQRFRLYMDYFRQATWLYSHYGEAAIVDLIQGGRARIKEIEQLLSNGNLLDLNLPSSSPDKNILRRAEWLAHLFSENEVVPPEAFYFVLLRHHKNVPQMSDELTHSALKQLQSRIFGVILGDDGGIEFEDFNALWSNRAFRYNIHDD